jgi:hypothetical protein
LKSWFTKRTLRKRCKYDFRLGADGEVRCIKCFVGDDEMELPAEENLAEESAPPAPEFWATQTNFEE